MNRRQFLAALACACTLGFASAARADFAGPVIAILDGDTIDVLIDRQPVRVRLAQIDAPEKRQAFGTRSRQALSSLVFRQSVTVVTIGQSGDRQIHRAGFARHHPQDGDTPSSWPARPRHQRFPFMW
ncbi:thermonuclease family protein [Escherichia coli]|nr:thermonuclease family protein [Escherichia coli]